MIWTSRKYDVLLTLRIRLDWIPINTTEWVTDVDDLWTLSDAQKKIVRNNINDAMRKPEIMSKLEDGHTIIGFVTIFDDSITSLSIRACKTKIIGL